MEVPTTDSALVADQDLDTRLPTTPNLSLILERKEIREHTPKKKTKKQRFMLKFFTKCLYFLPWKPSN